MIIPSVSQILYCLKDPGMDAIPDGNLATARDRGIAGHDTIRDLLVMGIETDHPGINKLNEWYKEKGFVMKEMETRKFSKDYHGKPDWYGSLGTMDCILDWKFKQKVSVRDMVQVAGAYTLLTGAKKAYICHFKDDEFKTIEFNKTEVLKYQRLFLNLKEIFYTFGLEKFITEDRSNV